MMSIGIIGHFNFNQKLGGYFIMTNQSIFNQVEAMEAVETIGNTAAIVDVMEANEEAKELQAEASEVNFPTAAIAEVLEAAE
jgi:hypothetical protein